MFKINYLKINNMERNITVTLEKAKEWYNSNNESLKELAHGKDTTIYLFLQKIYLAKGFLNTSTVKNSACCKSYYLIY